MKLGLIGGYGLEEILDESEEQVFSARFEGEKIKNEGRTIQPEFEVIQGKLEETEVLIVPRHGKNHKFPPHKVPFKSYFAKFEEEGINQVIATNSVGVMNSKFAVPSLFLFKDFVNEGQEVTFHHYFKNEPVHINLSNPYDPELNQTLLKIARELGIEIYSDVVYVNSEGPRLETEAEIKRKYSKLGDVIGMTGAKEVILANEKKIPMASIGVGANWAEGMGEQAKFANIKQKTEEMQEKVYRLITSYLKQL